MLSTFARLLVCLLLLCACAWSQSEVATATLSGSVTDATSAAIAGAKVTVTSTATGLTRTTETNEAGLYSFTRLPAGQYDLAVDMQGFKTARTTGIPLSVGAVANLDVRLEVGAAAEQVTVTAELPLVESTRSQTSTVVNEKAIADFPVNGRNFLDFTLLTPGVTRDYTRGGDISFGGQRGTANSLLVDGADSNNVFFGQGTGRAGGGRNPYSFSQDAVQEFQVNTNGYAAEIGRAGGGVINVITKGGTNDFHGTGFWFFRDKALNANTWANNRRGIPKRAYHFNQFGGNVGGPIVRNRAFFFFDYDGQRNTTPNPVFLQVPAPSDPLSQQALREITPLLVPYANGLDNNVYLAKVDFDLTSSQRVSFRYNANRFVGRNFEFTGPASTSEHTGNSNVSTDNFAVAHTAILSPVSVLETRFNYVKDDEPGESNSTAPEAQIRQSGLTVLYLGRNNFSPRYTNAHTTQFVETFSRTTGRHNLKFGGDLTFQRIKNFFPGNFSGSFIFNSYADFAARRAASFTQGFAGPGTTGPLTEPNANEYAFFAQDSWRVTDRLTFNYGARYDVFDYAQPSVKNPDPLLAAWNLDTSRINLDTNNLAGRFGFAYRLNESGSVAVRGGYGMFYGRTPAIMTGTATSQNGIQVQTYTFTTNIPVTYPNVLSSIPQASRVVDIYVFAPDYVQPLTHQWSFNLERQLGSSYAVTLGYLGVRGVHLSRTRDVNLFPSVPVQGSFADGTPVTFLRHPDGRPNPNFRRISLFDSGADSIYHGGFVQLTKRFAQNFQLQASYTLAKAIDTVPDFTSVVVGGGDDAKVAQDTLLPNLDRGPANADARHRFVGSGLVDVRGFQLSGILNLQSGRFYSPSIGGNSDVNNDGNSRNDRGPYVGRNTFEGPGFASLDVRVSRDIPFRERLRMKLIFEAFNVTNRVNYGTMFAGGILNGQYNFNSVTRVFTPVSTFGQFSDTFDPRIIQLAAKITF